MPEPQPVIGDMVEVRAPTASSTTPRLLGRVRIEDLTGVLRHISSRTGRNGPQGPLTQFMLKQGALQLAHGLGLTQPMSPPCDSVLEGGALSSLVGHERFVRQTMGLSVHNMERRWPMASDWYADLIAYVLRPQRHEANFAATAEELPSWFQLTLGGFVHAVAHNQVAISNDLLLYQLADSVKWLWPSYPPVQSAHRQELAAATSFWAPLYAEVLRVYDVRLRTGVTAQESAWTFMVLLSREAHDRAILPDLSLLGQAGSPRAVGARSCMLYIAGSVETTSGQMLSLTELEQRRPAHTPRLDSLISSA